MKAGSGAIVPITPELFDSHEFDRLARVKGTQTEKVKMEMADDIDEVVSQRGSWVYSGELRRYIVPFEAEDVSLNDTITISSLTTIQGVALVKKADGAAVDCTFLTNVITVTEAELSDVDLQGVAIGE